MPRKGPTVEFYDRQNQYKVPLMMYADFEAILEPIQSPNPDPNHTPARLINTFHLVGAYTASLHMEKLGIH